MSAAGMQRRAFVPLAIGSALAMAHGIGAAQDGAMVKSGRILDALRKDVAIDDGKPRPAGAQAARGRIDLQVQFAFNSADLLPEGRRQLDELAVALEAPVLREEAFEIAGHTDRVGDADYNRRLSLERATMVKSYLVTSHNVSPARLKTTGLGFTRLADPQQPMAAVNRRVEVRRLSSGTAGAPATVPATGGRLVPTPK